MNAIEVKISQIKNLNLVYLYNVDNVVSKNNKKYLGLKVVYDDNQNYISLDYKEKEFASLVKKTISLYNQEKDNRDIILLGNLSKKMFEDKELLSVLERTSEFSNEGIGLFNTSNERIKKFKPYLSEALKYILEYKRKMDGIEIGDIKGFNKKYIVTYKVGDNPLTFPIIINIINDNEATFKIGAIEGKDVGIEGTIINKIDEVLVSFKGIEDPFYGLISYNVKTSEVQKQIDIGRDTLYHSTELDTVTDEDINLVRFYLALFNINFSGEIIKTSASNFILGNKVRVAKDSEAEVINDTAIQLFIEDESVTINYRISSVINKLAHLVTIPLDQENYTITMKLKRLNQKNYIICELRSSNEFGQKYDYVAFKIDDIDLHHPFDASIKYAFDGIKSIYDLEKRLILKETIISDENGGND